MGLKISLRGRLSGQHRAGGGRLLLLDANLMAAVGSTRPSLEMRRNTGFNRSTGPQAHCMYGMEPLARKPFN